MRKIKFRAYNTRSKEVIYIDDLYWFEENFVNENGDDGWILSQLTGIKDGTGVDVYEDDIVEYTHGSVHRFRGVVKFMTDCPGCIHDCSPVAGWWLKGPGRENIPLDVSDEYNQFVILGDIHRNPELLEGGKE